MGLGRLFKPRAEQTAAQLERLIGAAYVGFHAHDNVKLDQAVGALIENHARELPVVEKVVTDLMSKVDDRGLIPQMGMDFAATVARKAKAESAKGDPTFKLRYIQHRASDQWISSANRLRIEMEEQPIMYDAARIKSNFEAEAANSANPREIRREARLHAQSMAAGQNGAAPLSGPSVAP